MLEGTKVLIVEDSPTQAEQLRYLLENRGFVVSHAEDGARALTYLQKQAPDLIITDIMMPEMDGYELTRRIKGDEDTRDIPVILLTMLSDPADVIKGLESGAENFVTKPYEEQHLLSRIEHILVNRELRKGGSPEDGGEVFFAGQKYHLTAERMQIIDFLLSTYETAINKNNQLEQEIIVRMRAEEELRRANTELEGFARTVSHDLKGPLAAVYAASEILSELVDEPVTDEVRADIRETTGVIGSSTLRSSALIDDILALAEAGQVPEHIEEVNVRDVVVQILKERASEIEERGIEVRLADDMGVLASNPTHIFQLFTNLIGNAIKHSDSPDPVIEVEFLGADEEGEHRYLVRDNGSGIPADQIDKIFIPFFKGESGGTGLGLATVDKIAGVYGGQVRAYNDNGACFEVMLNDFKQ